MDDRAWSAVSASRGYGHLDADGSFITDPPETGRAPMAQNCPRPSAEDRRHPLAPSVKPTAPQRIHATRDKMKPTRLKTMTDRIHTQPEPQQLPPRDNPALALSQPASGPPRLPMS